MDLKQILNLSKNEVCGLDIGSSAVKIVAMRKESNGYKLIAAGLSRIADRSIQRQNNGHDEIDTNTVKAIHDCFKLTRLKSKNRLRTKLAVCGVSGPEIAMRDFEFPPLPAEELDGAVALEAELICPFNPEQAAVDYQLISENADKTKGILVAATKTSIKNRKLTVQKAGLKCVLMDVDGLALLNCYNNLAAEQERSTKAVMNVGSSYTTLAIMNDEGRPFIRDTACAGDYIIERIAQANNISPEAVTDILFGDSPDGKIELGESVEKACDALVVDVAETLRFYAAGEKTKPIGKIFVCGGFAPAKGFVEMLSRRLGIEARLWNPFESELCHTSGKNSDFLRKKGPAMAVAAGLAMRSIEKNHKK
ncbi:MAG: type IV pilus assembly protein PilM [Sedimentisphaerales bacterium]|nr:type IV pilus assembly protein PilM [Sedimentisphaerales bacterium]